ncbi:DUF7312 domain-containing protein [Halodesulfurarchaeum sp.]|uniref:DUF7312 domain-containing protein n=1 Tax=Halodesulfurarchaeum sp. TaxID=1980530 RepID=UPI002FC31049
MSDWKYGVEDVGPEAEEPEPEIKAGSPKLEHVIPFLLGAGLAIALLLISI